MGKTMEQAIQDVAESKADHEVRVMRQLSVGKIVQQGDVYLHRVDADHPRGKLMKSRQVAEGTTVGARHVVEGDVDVYEGTTLPDYFNLPEDIEPEMLCGPVVVAHGPLTLTHPEHAHHKLPEGVYQVSYQFDPRTMKRVVD